MSFEDESLAELFEQYKDEVKESIGLLDTEIVSIEQNPDDSEVIFSIFRHLHSLKGSSKMFNVDNIGHIAHKLEDLMQMIDKDNTILGKYPKIVDLLFQGNDIFRDIISRLEDDITYINLTPRHAQFIEAIHQQIDQIDRKENALVLSAQTLLDEIEALLPSLEELETDRLVRAVEDLSSQINLMALESGAGSIRYLYGDVDLTQYIQVWESTIDKFRDETFQTEDVDAFTRNLGDLLQALFEVAEEDIMKILSELNDGLDMFEEKSLEIDQMVTEFFSLLLQDLKENLKAETAAPEMNIDLGAAPAGKETTAPKPRSPAQIQAKTIRVDEKKIDVFLESVGKLITQSEILNHLQYSFKGAGINQSLVRDFAAVNRTISNDIINLQKSIMEVRQVEMDNILKKFPRLVRDISHKMGKEVELTISGERIPIDKSLLDDVEQAMIHILRNCIDHGLETPAEREATGKHKRGHININVFQEEASVLVQIADDGRGLNAQAIKQRALDKGLVSRDEFDVLTDSEAEYLIFRSGLTTKTEATDISGRGVGMDVVLSNMKKWNGDVVLENQPGQGLTVRIHIPITNTLLTKEAILMKLDNLLFCLPLEYVVEIVTIPSNEIHQHKSQVVFEHRNQIISVINIKELLGVPVVNQKDMVKTFIILKGKSDNKKSIGADEIIGQQKIVIKDFEIDAFRRLPYFQGLTLLGDGRVVLVLDADRLVESME